MTSSPPPLDLPLTSRRSGSGVQGALQATFFRIRRPPRALQEPFKRLPAAIAQRSGNPMPFYIDFDLQKAPPGPQKSRKSIEKAMVFEEFAFRARVASWARFWTLLGSVLGAFWPPRWLKPVLEFLLERPRAHQEYFFSASEASNSVPRGARRVKKGSKKGPILEAFLAPKRLPRGSPEASKSSPRAPQRALKSCISISKHQQHPRQQEQAAKDIE